MYGDGENSNRIYTGWKRAISEMGILRPPRRLRAKAGKSDIRSIARNWRLQIYDGYQWGETTEFEDTKTRYRGNSAATHTQIGLGIGFKQLGEGLVDWEGGKIWKAVGNERRQADLSIQLPPIEEEESDFETQRNESAAIPVIEFDLGRGNLEGADVITEEEKELLIDGETEV